VDILSLTEYDSSIASVSVFVKLKRLRSSLGPNLESYLELSRPKISIMQFLLFFELLLFFHSRVTGPIGRSLWHAAVAATQNRQSQNQNGRKDLPSV
jgi:hypothetical protein